MKKSVIVEWIRTAGVLSVLVVAAGVLRAQQYHGLPTVSMQSPVVRDDSDPTVNTPQGRMMLKRQMKALNDLRQKALVADTDQLLALAQELNATTLPDGPKMSAVERMRKLAQIEKLAKRVRQKMSFGEWNPPARLIDPYSMTPP